MHGAVIHGVGRAAELPPPRAAPSSITLLNEDELLRIDRRMDKVLAVSDAFDETRAPPLHRSSPGQRFSAWRGGPRVLRERFQECALRLRPRRLAQPHRRAAEPRLGGRWKRLRALHAE